MLNSERRILFLIDSDQESVDSLMPPLSSRGYTVICFKDIEGPAALAVKSRPDAILLNRTCLNAWGQESMDAAQELSSALNMPFVLFGTEHGSTSAKFAVSHVLIQGIADPAVVLSVLDELFRKRCVPADMPQRMSLKGVLTIDSGRRIAKLMGQKIDLTPAEFAILTALAVSTPLAVSREAILKAVWGDNPCVTERTVDVHIRSLRKKLGEHSHYVSTVRNSGYALVVPSSDERR